jgi:hypothetical protein
MEEQMSREQALESIRRGWEALDATLAQVPEAWMVQPGVEDEWSVKDILAHITTWEERMLRWIQAARQGEAPELPAPGMGWDDVDRLNAQTYAANRERPLDEVLVAYRALHRQALAAVESLGEAELLDPQRFPWLNGMPMWHLVAANTWWHYREHGQAIQDWIRDGQALDPPPAAEG